LRFSLQLGITQRDPTVARTDALINQTCDEGDVDGPDDGGVRHVQGGGGGGGDDDDEEMMSNDSDSTVCRQNRSSI